MFGQGGTLWQMADASPPDTDHWQTIEVDPAVVAARVAGISYGFLLFDDTGSEWTRHGEEFKLRHMLNRFVHSRESGPKFAPYLTVDLGEKDDQPPAAPTGLQFDAADLPAGEARLSWITPGDPGPAGTIGFNIEMNGVPLPRYLIPAAGKPGGRVGTVLRDLGLKPGEIVNVTVRAVGGTGKMGPGASIAITTSDEVDAPLPGKSPEPLMANGPLPTVGGVEITVIDAMDKIEPATGKMIPEEPPEYLLANHLWQAGTKLVRLHGAKNEFVSFQIIVHGRVEGLKAQLSFDGNAATKPQATFSRLRYVPSRAGFMPDPIVPMAGGFSVPSADDQVAGQQFGSILCEVYIPHEAIAGEQKGLLTLAVGGEELKLNLSLTVWDFTLPDFLSFLPEMNSYGLPDNDLDYYRLAHLNRTVINRVPYHQSGDESPGCAPDGMGGPWTSRGGTGGLGRSSTGRHLPICRGREYRLNVSICR